MNDASFLIAVMLLLNGGMLAQARPPQPVADSRAVLLADDQSTDASASAGRKEYIQRAQEQIHLWQRRMNELAEETKAKAVEGGGQAQQALDDAWADVKTNWQRLQAAAPDAWEKTRATFEEASERMKSTWQKVHPPS
jgi:hypothetical protein